jgi:hypothetical protein
MFTTWSVPDGAALVAFERLLGPVVVEGALLGPGDEPVVFVACAGALPDALEVPVPACCVDDALPCAARCAAPRVPSTSRFNCSNASSSPAGKSPQRIVLHDFELSADVGHASERGIGE